MRFFTFIATELFLPVISKRKKHKLCIHNGSWHETLNLLHVGSYEMLHFVMSYTNENKKCKQALKSAQCRLEIIVHISLESVFKKLQRYIFKFIQIRGWLHLSQDGWFGSPNTICRYLLSFLDHSFNQCCIWQQNVQCTYQA